jgi:bifunctional DNase/RNase
MSYLGGTSPPSEAPSPPDPGREVEIEVETVIISEVYEQQIIVLQEVGGSRSFPIVIGIFEATVIDRTLRGLGCPRPLTFEAWLSTLDAVGTRVRAAVIRDREESTYFADLRLTGRDGEVAVDMRPSDAVHLAIKARAPILIREALLNEVFGSGSS